MKESRGQPPNVVLIVSAEIFSTYCLKENEEQKLKYMYSIFKVGQRG